MSVLSWCLRPDMYIENKYGYHCYIITKNLKNLALGQISYTPFKISWALWWDKRKQCKKEEDDDEDKEEKEMEGVRNGIREIKKRREMREMKKDDKKEKG